MKVLEIKSDRIRVETEHCGITAIAKHEDDNGIYFYNENLDKEYVQDSDWVVQKKNNKVSKDDTQKVHPNKKGEFTFNVVIYSTDGWTPGRHFTKTFKADTYGEAENKLVSHYKNIFDAELIEAKDKFGNDINPF